MVITGLTRNQLSGSYRTKGSNPLLSAKKAVIPNKRNDGFSYIIFYNLETFSSSSLIFIFCGQTVSHFPHLIQSAAVGLSFGKVSFACALVILAPRYLL